MRMLTKSGLNARAVLHRNPDGAVVVRLKAGVLWYELASGEAVDLARELLRASADANAANGDTC